MIRYFFLALLLFFTSSSFGQMANPEDIELEGSIRKVSFNSSLGTVDLRWQRKVEKLFGRTPQKAVSDAMLTASKALRQSGFPSELRLLRKDWQIVFMDENIPVTQIPSVLISNCHPAWMTPEANIYVVANRAAAGCGGATTSSQVADSSLVQILLHEIGHVLEYTLLGNAMNSDRMRAEGFASWFEQYSSDYSSIVRDGESRDKYTRLSGVTSKEIPPFVFQGTAQDYAKASLYFWKIVDTKGVYSLMKVYEDMKINNSDFFSSTKKKLYIDLK